jgi:hypothetical protein
MSGQGTGTTRTPNYARRVLTRASSPVALHDALLAGGFSSSQTELGEIWPIVKRWLARPVEPADARLQVVLLESGLNRSSEGRGDHPLLPAGLVPRPLFNLVALRAFDTEVDGVRHTGQDEHGVEWWYEPDARWEAIAAGADWDAQHPIGYSMLAQGPDAVPGFLRQVEQTPMFAAALAGRAVLTRAFGFDIDGGELVAT